MRRIIHTCTFVFVLLVAISVVQILAADETEENPQMVNLELQNTTVVKAIEALFDDTEYKYIVKPGVSGKVVELKLKGITFQEALDTLTKAADLEYTVEDNIYIIGAKSQAGYNEYENTKKETSKIEREVEVESENNAEQQFQEQAEQAPQVVINQGTPAYYGHVPPPTLYGPPVYRFGSVQIIGGHPPIIISGRASVLMRGQLPPPPGWVSPDVLRFIRAEYSIMPKYFYTPPIYGW